jgi:hypothetical protein
MNRIWCMGYLLIGVGAALIIVYFVLKKIQKQ